MNKTRRRKARARRHARKHGQVVFQNAFMTVRWFPLTDPTKARLHEEIHRALHEMYRPENRSPLWNIAKDYAINEALLEGNEK